MKQNIIETIVGAIVIVVALAFFIYAYTSNSKKETSDGYIVTAKFQSAEGIIVGSDVKVAGIDVGNVEELDLDKATYFAIVKMRIGKDVEIPSDSSAAIVSNGLLGGKFISIVPGAEETNLQENDAIKFTQSSVNLESLLSKFMFSTNANKN